MAEVFSCQTVDQFKQKLDDGKNSPFYYDEIQAEAEAEVVVDFTATWCAPCRFMAPILSEFANKYTDVLFLKVDVDELKTVAEDYKIESMPAFVFLKDGAVVDRFVGANKESLNILITEHSGRSLTETDTTPVS